MSENPIRKLVRYTGGNAITIMHVVSPLDTVYATVSLDRQHRCSSSSRYSVSGETGGSSPARRKTTSGGRRSARARAVSVSGAGSRSLFGTRLIMACALPDRRARSAGDKSRVENLILNRFTFGFLKITT